MHLHDTLGVGSFLKIYSKFHRNCTLTFAFTCRSTYLVDDPDIDEAIQEPTVNLTDIQPTKLFSRNKDVDCLNAVQLELLEGDTHTYAAKDDGKPNYLQQLIQGMKAPQTLHLRVGAQVRVTLLPSSPMGTC